MTIRLLPFAVLLLALAGTGCAGRRSDDDVPESAAEAPEIRLSYTEQRGHNPGNGTLRAIVRDAGGDLAKATLDGPSVALSRVVSGSTDSLTTEPGELPEGAHVYVGTVTDRGGRTGSDTLTIHIGPNHPPPSNLTATGDGPWWRLVQETAVDPQGDPVEYSLVVEGPLSFQVAPRGAPIDTTVTLPSGLYHATSITGDGHTEDTTTRTLDVVVRPPTASQSIEREGTSLRYRAEVSADHAELAAVRAPDEVFYHGTVPRDTTFAGLTAGDDSGLPKGDYFFRLYGRRHGHQFDETAWGHIVDLEPSVDLSGIDLSLDAGKKIVVPLPAPRDPNPEDHPTYTRATSVDGKVSVDLNDSELRLEAVADSTGPFRVELVVGDATTGAYVDTLSATIRPLPAVVDTAGFKSGYGEIETDGGGTSVNADLKDDDEDKNPIFDINFLKQKFGGYYRFKRRLKDDYGVAFGIDYSFLNQYSSFSTTDTQAASGIFRMYGTWKLAGQRGSDWAGLVFRVENRHLVGQGITPRDLGFDGGSSVSTATFNDSEWGMTAMYWKHRFSGGRVAIGVGNLDAGNFSDTYALRSAYKFFLNEAFKGNPSVPLPQQGLGLVARFTPVGNWYAKGGVHDANGSPHRVGFDTFFETREYFTWVEAGWSPGQDPLPGQSTHLNLWHQDPREAEGTEEAWGVTVSASQAFDDRWVPFFRAGYSDGDGGQNVRAAVAGGIGAIVRGSDFIGLATGWSAPLDEDRRNQLTSELIYRAQLTQNTAVSPGIQFTIHPSETTETDYLSVASAVRVRFAF